MTEIDQFESAFKAADKTPFSLKEITIRRMLVVTDLDNEASEAIAARMSERLKPTVGDAELVVEWLARDSFESVSDLLAQVDRHQTDLICTYRNLRIPAREHPHSLGVYVDVLTQVGPAPVMLFPRPNAAYWSGEKAPRSDNVMAITDHLTGDHQLVSYAAHLTSPGGKLWLTHVEDAATYERYVATIGKIATIDTDSAAVAIRRQLLKEPREYIASCREVLKKQQADCTVEEVVTLGHRLSDYRRLIAEHAVDLLVMNTKDDDQLAMHGLAYPLSVELRETPLLLL